MKGREKSDERVVPAKPLNKGGNQQVLSYGEPYTGTKVETPDTAKGKPKARLPAGIPTAEAVEERRSAKENPTQQTTHRTQGRKRVQHALQRVRQAAEREGKMQFTTLFHHVYNVDALREAYFGLSRKAAPGVDGVMWQRYGENLEENLRDLSRRLKRGAYRAKPVRRVYIPKPDGRKRPLGVTALEDKIVQLATVGVLNAIYEVDFVGFSYGFRPGRGQHDALDALVVGIERGRVNWVLDADIRAFFDEISHEWLMKFIEHRIADRRMLRLIRKWLKAGVLEDGKRIGSEKGTPQGGNVSPVLANLYLHYIFDLWAHQWRKRHGSGKVRIVRYADDVLVGFESKRDAERFLSDLRDRFARFGLELHPMKTRLLEFGRFAADNRRRRGLGKPETFDFLGFTHICGKSPKGYFRIERQTMRKRLRSKLKDIKSELKRRRHAPVPEQGAWLRSVLLGHYRYYGVPHNSRALGVFRDQVIRHWRQALSRRSQKGWITRARMTRIEQRWLPRPKICHPFPIHRFDVQIHGRSPVH